MSHASYPGFFPSTGRVARFFAHILYKPFMRSSHALNTANGVQTKRGTIFLFIFFLLGAARVLSDLLLRKGGRGLTSP